jgi:hypothetical protein
MALVSSEVCPSVVSEMCGNRKESKTAKIVDTLRSCGSARYISHRIYYLLQPTFIQNVETLVGGDLYVG